MSPAPGTRGAPAAGKRRASEGRARHVPYKAAPGSPESAAGARAGRRVSRLWRRSRGGPLSRAAAAPNLPGLGPRERAAAAAADGAARASGHHPRPRARGGRRPLAAAPRDRVRRSQSAPSSAVWKLFSQARARRGHAAALGWPGPGRLRLLGRDLASFGVCRRVPGHPGTGLGLRATLFKKTRLPPLNTDSVFPEWRKGQRSRSA